MTVRPRPARTLRQDPDPEPPRLPLRWFVIAAGSAGGYVAGAAGAGPGAGVGLAVMVAGVLHAILE